LRVRCTRLQDNLGKPLESDGWLTVGREYMVLCIYVDASRGVLLRLMGDDNFTPAMFPGEQFEVTEQTIPNNWIVKKENGGDFSFGPKAWSEAGFWERYFDREETAVAIFHEQRDLMNP
jgi:hypothetical protein